MTVSQTSVLAAMVRKLSSHSPVTAAEQDVLLSLPHQLGRLDRGDYLVRDGDKATRCAVLLSGFAYRSKVAGNGARQILSVHLRGDMIDLQNGMLEIADHSVQALTRIQVAYIPFGEIKKAANAHPGIAQAFWRDTLIDASIFREWILNVGRRDARQRISHLLCELALRQEIAGVCMGPRYAWPMTQAEIGDAAGLTTVHVNRTLQALRGDGLISKHSGDVEILDWSGLQDAGDFSAAYLHQPVRGQVPPSIMAPAGPRLLR